jgi:hypothetical protein
MKHEERDPIEIVILTKDNIPEIAERLGKSEEYLFRSWSEANSKDEVCYVAFDLWP